MALKDPLFHLFNRTIDRVELPEKFTYPFSYEPNKLSLEASHLLKSYLETQTDLNHNFGLDPDSDQRAIGKMFGVLVVETLKGEIGYLAGFSGGLTEGTEHPGFVPPVYDSATYSSFVNDGMGEITLINDAIKRVKIKESPDIIEKINLLKQLRKDHSVSLLNKIFDQYLFVNQSGEERSLKEIFKYLLPKSPPGGAGECAAPKLLQYAFKQKMKPIAMAEFWWGKNPKKVNVEHGKFYPSCLDKCKPILTYMLHGIEMEEPLSEI